MRWFVLPVLYTALALGANAVASGTVMPEDLRESSMKKLVFTADPADVPDLPLVGMDGAEHRLSDFKGQVTVVNFWAVWCTPCRKELPALDRLGKVGPEGGYSVVTVATGRNPPAAIERLFAEVGVSDLTVLLDRDQSLSREMGVFGLPVTVILDREGREIARMTGEAEWDSESARAILALLAAN